jgi:hypothetical protein
MITVHRQAGDATRPATWNSPEGPLVAQWQGKVEATQWLEDLVEEGSAIHLGGDAYPFKMTARAGAVVPVVRDSPPHANERWIVGKDDIVDWGRWPGRTVYSSEEAEACHDDEWLLITIFDES